ncbi:MAG: phosphoenolpyruvate carboxykinase (ATP) [Bacteroidales bacterium]|nr:phosphoenolpyruvate carboxykinase (ATP) [Candidatus Latescibacterota bacterium]
MRGTTRGSVYNKGVVVPDSSGAISKTLADRLTGYAVNTGNFVSDSYRILTLSLKDSVTLEARSAKDVLNKNGSLSYITRKTSRSAAMTEIFFGDPDKRQSGIMEAACEYIERRIDGGMELLYLDKLMGLHPDHSHYCRTIITPEFARMLVMWDRLIFDVPEERLGGGPDQVQVMIPEWAEYARLNGLPEVAILVDAVNNVTFALGSDYFGEIKKGHLRMAMYREKLKYRDGSGGGLGVHAGGKVIRAKDSASGRLEEKGALFFGLSGTGKTTLSVHHFWLDPEQGESVIIRQDDFFVLAADSAAFGTEDNAYIKTEGLEPKSQQLLFEGAMSPHSILENVYVDPETLEPDFFRFDHPWTPGGMCYNGRGIVIRKELDFTDDRVDLDRVDMIFFITRRETVIPPVMRLSTEQAAAAFMLGESILTSAADPTKAGQSVLEVGTNPFIVGSGGEEGNIFYSILKNNPHIRCYLFNTGGFGGRNVDAGSENLAGEGVMEVLKSYLAGQWQEGKGCLVRRKLMDGAEEEFKVERVRLELDGDGRRYRSRGEIQTVVDMVEAGEIDAKDFQLVRVEVLAGQKVKIQDSSAFIREIARGTVEWAKEDYWGYDVPTSMPGMDLSRFDEKRYYTESEIKELKDRIRAERIEWLHSFDDLDPEIRDIFG